jgi:2-polyprenyl-3-methyl-5-hydroxy-6-metoxy-1,4-benzoquinol methylase
MDSDTSGEWYTDRLQRITGRGWKRFVPDPYRWNLRRLKLGRTLDVGCGIGRCLAFIDGNGVGVDHNEKSVEVCRSRGLEAYTPDEFRNLDAGLFDSILLSHVLEHTTVDEGQELLTSYVRYLKPGGRILLITPQLAGQKSDPTHVRLLDTDALRSQIEELGGVGIKTRSFPFPRFAGGIFRYNESQAIGAIPGGVAKV